MSYSRRCSLLVSHFQFPPPVAASFSPSRSSLLTLLSSTMRPPLRSTRSKSFLRTSEAREGDSQSEESFVSSVRTVPVQPITIGSLSVPSTITICDMNYASFGPPKKARHRMTDLQLEKLEALYQRTTHPTREEKQQLGTEVDM